MALYTCQKRHFAAGGELVKVGDEVDFKSDPGSLWVKSNATEKKLEVATPKKPEDKK